MNHSIYVKAYLCYNNNKKTSYKITNRWNIFCQAHEHLLSIIFILINDSFLLT